MHANKLMMTQPDQPAQLGHAARHASPAHCSPLHTTSPAAPLAHLRPTTCQPYTHRTYTFRATISRIACTPFLPFLHIKRTNGPARYTPLQAPDSLIGAVSADYFRFGSFSYFKRSSQVHLPKGFRLRILTGQAHLLVLL